MNKQEHLAAMVTAEIVFYIIKDMKLSPEEAMQRFYNSEVFEKLQDPETGLYRESPAYVYDLYQIELAYGHLIQLEA
jgi:hypothetical protein